MEYKVDTNPSLFINPQSGTTYSFDAEEEIFVINDDSNERTITIDFEKRKLYCRCIIRLIDYKIEKVYELSAAASRFKIKSTFAPLPFSPSGMIFQGGGFTASAVAKDDEIGIIVSAPEMIINEKERGLHLELRTKNIKENPSFNSIVFEKNKSESFHTSPLSSFSGYITMNEKKTVIKEENFSGKHIWKHTSFTKRKEKPVVIINGANDGKPYYGTIHSFTNKAVLFSSSLQTFDSIKWTEIDGDTFLFSNHKEVELKAKIFASIYKKRGPFRRANTVKYALFSGHMGETKIDKGRGYIDFPDL